MRRNQTLSQPVATALFHIIDRLRFVNHPCFRKADAQIYNVALRPHPQLSVHAVVCSPPVRKVCVQRCIDLQLPVNFGSGFFSPSGIASF